MELAKSQEEDALFAEHPDVFWEDGIRMEKQLFRLAFSEEEPDMRSLERAAQRDADFQTTFTVTPELLRIYIVSGMTMVAQEAVRRGVPAETAMEIRRRAFVAISKTSQSSSWLPIFEALIRDIHRAYRSSISAISDPLVRKACAYIYQHRQHPITASDVAASLAVNRTCLARRFRSCLHESISGRILEVKMQEAEEWIREGKYPLQDISTHLGFSSYAYFSRRFCAFHGGVTPREFAAAAPSSRQTDRI
ncbi:MAG: helix-turn-helix domain-containing protein [Lachnospiraceae bacterium]